MISPSEARRIITQHIRILPAERQPLAAILGRVLRRDVLASEDSPAFDRSAMDGYATLADEKGMELRVVGEVLPGIIPDLLLKPGECVRIFTGAALPVNAGRVLPQEWVTRRGDVIQVNFREAQSFVRRRGDDAKRGDVLLNAGVRLGAGELSLLAQVGETAPEITSRPRVAHIATGSELVPPDQIPAPGQIRDSNSTLISALLHEAGTELIVQERCGDDPERLLDLASTALNAGCDMLLFSGGASVGDYDFGPRVLERLGFTIHFRQIDVRPGKPLVFATREDQLAFVIPGNPVSHFVTFHLAILGALDSLQGAEAALPIVPVQLLTPIPAQRDTRETYWPAKLSWHGGRLCAEALKWQSSGDLRGLVGANGLLLLLPGMTPAQAGEELPCMMLTR